ncbi:hypothetical protein B566_EDAN004948 [Ephemera danica]|nr:hypothetical protein B566_EDAN004948 [Ephemera danica]
MLTVSNTMKMASTSRAVDSPVGRKRQATLSDDSLDMKFSKQIKVEVDDAIIVSDPESPLCPDDVESQFPLQESLQSCLHTNNDYRLLGPLELKLLSISSFMKQNTIPEQFLRKYVGDVVETDANAALNNLQTSQFLQQHEVGKLWTITSTHQEKIKHLISRSANGDKIKSSLLERALEVLILEISNRKEGYFPYSSYIQDLVVSGMEIWEHALNFKNLVVNYYKSLSDFAVASYEEMPTPSLSILFSSKAIRQLCRHFGRNNSKTLEMKICMTSIQARNGKSQEALAELDEYVKLVEISDDINIRMLLFSALEKKSQILNSVEKNCNEALNICDKIFNLDKAKYEIGNSRLLQVKLFKCKILNSVGQYSEALDVCDGIISEIQDVASLESFSLKVKLVVVEILQSMEKNELALTQINDIITSLTDLFGASHSSVLEARTQKSEILEEMSKLDESLEELNCILKIHDEKYGSNHIKSMHTKSNIARVLVSKDQRVEATKLLNSMLETITLKYGPNSRELTQFLEFKTKILKEKKAAGSLQENSNLVAPPPPPHQLNFRESLNTYEELKRIYIMKYDLSPFDAIDVIENVALHHYRNKNWNSAIIDARWIVNKINSELGENHQGLEHPLNIMVESYFNLEDEANELQCQEMLYKNRMLNYGEMNVDTHNTLMRMAELQKQMQMLPNALVSYETIYKLSKPTDKESRKKLIILLYKIAKLQLKLLLYADALNNFETVDNRIQQENFENKDEYLLKTKYNIALCHLRQSDVRTALTLSKELHEEVYWHYGHERHPYSTLSEFCQSLFDRQNKGWRRRDTDED